MKHIAWNLLLAAQLPQCPITKCGKSGCAGSSPLSEVEYGYKAGMEPAMCAICGMAYPRVNITADSSSRMSPRSSVVSQVETVLLQAAVGPCAPSELVSFSSCLDVSCEHAVISGFFLLSQQLRYKTHLVLIDQVHSLS